MKNINKFFTVLLFFYSGPSVFIASSLKYLPSFSGGNSKIFVIEEDESDDLNKDFGASNSTGDTSADSFTLTNHIKYQAFIDALKKNDELAMKSLIQSELEDIHDQQDLTTPFFIADDKKNLLTVKYELPFEVHQKLTAVGGGLTTEEYKLLYRFELESSENDSNIEDLVKASFLDAILQGNLTLVKSLVDIDTALRLQNFLLQEYHSKCGPLLTTTFNKNMTGLHYAVINNNFDMVKFFVENGAFINARSDMQQINVDDSESYQPLTPLDFAIVQRRHFNDNDDRAARDVVADMENNSKIINFLIAKKADLKSYDQRIQPLIRKYMSERIKAPTMQLQITISQSIRNFFGTNSAKVIPM